MSLDVQRTAECEMAYLNAVVYPEARRRMRLEWEDGPVAPAAVQRAHGLSTLVRWVMRRRVRLEPPRSEPSSRRL
jgi:hypothetical protein